METGATTLAFASNALGESNLPGGFRKNNPAEPPAGAEVALVAEDVSAAFRSALEVGATAVAEPKTKPWGQTVAYVRDPDGGARRARRRDNRLARRCPP
jgi:lactoylglutathione lyase